MNSQEKPKQTCAICGKEFVGYGHNPWPTASQGRACDDCNGAVMFDRIMLQKAQGKY